MDAGNILKPALARGELQLAGATTLNEISHHRKSMQPFERRMQPVKKLMNQLWKRDYYYSKGIQKKYEDYHHSYTDGAYREAAATLLTAIQDRFAG